MLTNEQRQGIENFVISCNELIYGKFILASNKISKILKSIVESKDIFALLSNCQESFNFDREFAYAKVKSPNKAGYFVAPDDKETLLSLVFCLLVDINQGQLDFAQFLKDYFSLEEKGLVGYQKFAQQLIVPFKDTIANYFEIPVETMALTTPKQEEIKMENTIEESVQTTADFDDLIIYAEDVIKIAKEMISNIENERKIDEIIREDAIYLLNSLISACESKEIKYINSLIIALGYVCQRIKSTRFIMRELQTRMTDYYQV